MVLLTLPQILFITIVPTVVIIAVLIFGFIPLRKWYRKKNYLNVYYKTVRSIALNQDYYLINNFKFRVSGNKRASINHVLFADKYIYLIICNHYDGDLIGQEQDKYLVLVPRKGKKKYVTNLFVEIKKLTERLAIHTDQDLEIFIGIILTNDDVNIGVEATTKHFYMVQRNRLSHLIRAIESRDIPPLNEDQLANAVRTFAEANLRNEPKNKEKENG